MRNIQVLKKLRSENVALVCFSILPIKLYLQENSPEIFQSKYMLVRRVLDIMHVPYFHLFTTLYVLASYLPIRLLL